MIFIKNKNVQESSIDKLDENINVVKNSQDSQAITFNTENFVKKYSEQKDMSEKLIISEMINNNFYVITINLVREEESKGYIVVSEIANDILIAVKERNNFILRTVFFVAIVIIIFSIFLIFEIFLLKEIIKRAWINRSTRFFFRKFRCDRLKAAKML